MTSAHARAAMLIQPITGLRWFASALIPIVAVLNITMSWALWDSYYLIESYLQDGPVTFGDLTAADDRNLALLWIYLGALVVTGVAFIVWLVRARANAERLCVARHTLSTGWVIGGWIVPIVNLWFPFQVVRDVWKASKPENRGVGDLSLLRGSPLVALWWGLWVVALVIDRFGFLGEPENAEDFQQLAIWQTFVSVLQLAAAVVILRVMAQISGWQEQARRALA